MAEIQILVTADGERVPLVDPPAGFVPGEGEEVITEFVSEAEFAQLTDPERQDFKIYQFTEGYVADRTLPPTEIDYRLLNLHRKEMLDRGLRARVDYYGQSDGTIYSDVVVREQHEYEWLPYRSIPSRRTIIIDWILGDGSIGHSKTKTRYFTITEGSKLHQKRKQANIAAMKESLLGLFIRQAGQTEGYARVTAMFSAMFIAVQTYEQAQEQPLLDIVATHIEPILDAALYANGPTIRQYLLDELTIPVYVPE